MPASTHFGLVGPSPAAMDRRASDRIQAAVPARLMWKDRSGAARFASVVTRDLSEQGMFVECRTPLALSLYRLVYVQLDGERRSVAGLPRALEQGRVLAAVYRVQPLADRGGAQGFALRLMIEPKRQALPLTRPSRPSPTWATA